MSTSVEGRRRGLRPTARAAALALLAALAALLAGCGGEPGTPSAPSASSVSQVQAPPVDVGVPTRVEIPAIEVDEALVPVGLMPDGAMDTPDFGLAAWYDLGPRPGAPGPAVVLAHVDSKAGPDVFHRLRELEPGDRVTVHRDDGSSTFLVDALERVDKTELPYERIWTDTPEPLLRLITCGGAFDHGTGHYRDNIIVYAHLA